MKRLPPLLLALLCACGPTGSTAAIFKLISAGEGADLVTSITNSTTARWTYLISAGTGSGTITTSYYLDQVQLPEGPLVSRYVTDTQLILQEQTSEGRYYWGSSDGDVLKSPLVDLSYPLRVGRKWTSGNDQFPDWYQYTVDAVETIEVPAGRFDSVRVLQFNSRDGSTITRWFVDDIGLVQRQSPPGPGVSKTVLLSFQGETP